MYVFKNLKYLLKNNTTLLLILLCTLFISFTAIYFSVGIFFQYVQRLEDSEIDQYALGSEINDTITRNEMAEFIGSLDKECIDDISFITCFSETAVTGISESVPICFYLQFDGKSIEYSDYVFGRMEEDMVLKDGRFFTQDEFAFGENVAVIMGDGNELQMTAAPKQSKKITAFGKDYDVIGVINPNNDNYYFYSVYVPFLSIPDDTNITNEFFISFNKKLTISEYEKITEQVDEFFGSKVSIYETQIDLKSNYEMYITVILIVLLCSIISTLNISVIYNYIITIRTMQNRVFKLCGARSKNICMNTANEVAVLVIPTGAVAAIIYQCLIVPRLSDVFTIFTSCYDLNIYLSINAVYLILSYVSVLLISYNRMNKT